MNELRQDVKAAGKRMHLFGGIAIVLGILAMLAPGLTGISIAMMLGVLVLAGGVVRMLSCFQAGSFGKGLLKFVGGVLTLICGLMLVGNPLITSGLLTIMLAVYFVVDGISEMATGFQARPADGSGWLIFGGIISIWLGIMIWRQFPLSGVWAMGILLGIRLFTVGLTMVAGGSAVRSLARE